MNRVRQSNTLDGSAGGEADRLSPAWWLVLPLAIAAALSLTAHAVPGFYQRWLVAERGLLEMAQLLILLWVIVVALKTLFLRALRTRPLLAVWVAVAAVASLYVAGEEASWGQHYFDWATPAYWATVNDQGETNLHNVSSWLDQKPRALLEVGVILGGVVIPLAALWRPALRRVRGAIVLPPLACLPTAALAEFARFSERILDSFGYQVYPFERSSEVQEFYFYLFVMLYLTVLHRRLSAGGLSAEPAARPERPAAQTALHPGLERFGQNGSRRAGRGGARRSVRADRRSGAPGPESGPKRC